MWMKFNVVEATEKLQKNEIWQAMFAHDGEGFEIVGCWFCVRCDLSS
jgi:hypothetical protein